MPHHQTPRRSPSESTSSSAANASDTGGFLSQFGRVAGALIDEVTGDVIPLERKGNLYVLRCWLKAAPFGRPDKL